MEAKGEIDLNNRIEIIKRYIEYENNPSEFLLKWKERKMKIGSLIDKGEQ